MGDFCAYPIADNVKLWANGLLMTVGGFAKPGATATGGLCIGRSRRSHDNTVTGHSAGKWWIEAEEGRFAWAQSGTTITEADVGAVAYIVDDQTVSKTNAGQSVAGIIRRVDADSVWVESSLTISTMLSGESAAEVGGQAVDVVGPKTSAYTAAIGDFVLVDPTATVVTITLPSPVGLTGQSVTVKDSTGTAATHTITVATTTGTIDGSATATITTNRAAKKFVSDGTNWQSA